MKHHMRSRARVESVVHQLNYQLLVGIDLGQWLHQACVLDANGEFLGERGFEHSLSALSATTDWLLNLAGKDAERIAVAIEKPHGAVVETLLDSGIAVFSINSVLSYAHDPVRLRNLEAFRSLSGIAPVTQKSGKRGQKKPKILMRRARSLPLNNGDYIRD